MHSIDNIDDYMVGVGAEIVFPTAREAFAKAEETHEKTNTEEYLIFWLELLAKVIDYKSRSGLEQLKTTQDQLHTIYWSDCFRSDRCAEVDLGKATERVQDKSYPLRSFAFPYVRRYILHFLIAHAYKAEFNWNSLRNEWVLTVKWGRSVRP